MGGGGRGGGGGVTGGVVGGGRGWAACGEGVGLAGAGRRQRAAAGSGGLLAQLLLPTALSFTTLMHPSPHPPGLPAATTST